MRERLVRGSAVQTMQHSLKNFPQTSLNTCTSTHGSSDSCPVQQLLIQAGHALQRTPSRAVPQGPGGAGQPEAGAHYFSSPFDRRVRAQRLALTS